MSMFFNSWKDEDADAYWGCGDASGHYYRGYYDGQEDGRKENEGNLDKAYRKGIEVGRKKAIEKLMKTLFDLFGDDITVAYLDTMCSRIQEPSNDESSNDESSLEPALNDALEESSPDDSLDDKILKYVNSEKAAINDIIHSEFSSYGSITLKDKGEDK